MELLKKLFNKKTWWGYLIAAILIVAVTLAVVFTQSCQSVRIDNAEDVTVETSSDVNIQPITPVIVNKPAQTPENPVVEKTEK